MALGFQSLPHYSDFDATSESGWSELSYVYPEGLKRITKVDKLGIYEDRPARRRGARAARRSENEAFLNNLFVLSEADIEEASPWPDYVTHPSAFTKLFEDDGIRAVWDLFISLSEKEQAQLLKSLKRSNGAYPPDSDDSLDLGDNGDIVRPVVQTRRNGRPLAYRRHPKRGHRKNCKTNLVGTDQPVGQFMENSISIVDQELCTKTTLWTIKEDLSSYRPPTAMQSSLPSRLIDILSNAIPTNHGKNQRHRSKRSKRCITPLDFCLITCVEEELRRWFRLVPTNDDTSNLHRWTPTISLLGEAKLQNDVMVKHFPQLLQLDAFGRLLVHSVADYLGLVSYSSWSESLGDRQLWVEQCIGCPFNPPQDKLMHLLEIHFLTKSAQSPLV